jgi:hypothetical protein
MASDAHLQLLDGVWHPRSAVWCCLMFPQAALPVVLKWSPLQPAWEFPQLLEEVVKHVGGHHMVI